jgi:hypothetical protein
MDKGNIFAGWATADITPDRRVNLQGQFYERISVGIHDRIYATALAIQSKEENGAPGDQAVMISCDLVSVNKVILDKLRNKLNGRIADLDTSKILMFAIHTHTAPYVRDEPLESFNWTAWKGLDNKEYMHPSEYIEFLTDRLAEAVTEAWNNRRPSKVGIGLGHAVLGHCRRVVFDDRALMYASPGTANFIGLEGPSDHGVELMYFWDMNDKLTGVIINAACPAQVVEGENVISADYFGAARRKIKEYFTDDVHVLPQIAPAGDQSPRDLIRRGKSENIMRSFEGMEELGQRIADACIRGYEGARKAAETAGKLVFSHVAEDIYLPIRKVTMGEVEQAQREYDDLMSKYGSEEKVSGGDFIRLFNCRAVLIRKEVQEKAPFYKMELHALRLGDAAFVTNPFELYIEYGLRIKARSKAKQTFAIQLSCGSGGYLPTRKAISGGSYGAGVSNGIVCPEGGDLLVEHSVAAINKFWGDKGYTEKIRGL